MGNCFKSNPDYKFGTGIYEGILYCGRTYNNNNDLPYCSSNGVCGPDCGNSCQLCESILSYALYKTGETKCNNNHQLVRYKSYIMCLKTKENNIKCNYIGCRNIYINQNNPGLPFFYCEKCNYILCSKCAKKILIRNKNKLKTNIAINSDLLKRDHFLDYFSNGHNDNNDICSYVNCGSKDINSNINNNEYLNININNNNNNNNSKYPCYQHIAILMYNINKNYPQKCNKCKSALYLIHYNELIIENRLLKDMNINCQKCDKTFDSKSIVLYCCKCKEIFDKCIQEVFPEDYYFEFPYIEKIFEKLLDKEPNIIKIEDKYDLKDNQTFTSKMRLKDNNNATTNTQNTYNNTFSHTFYNNNNIVSNTINVDKPTKEQNGELITNNY